MSKESIADFYIRLSSKPQEKGMSKTFQIKECKRYCKNKGYKVRNIYYENKSAKTPEKRPVFNELIARQKTKDRADVIVVYAVNRLARNPVDFYQIRELVDKYNTEFVFIREGLTIKKPFKAHQKYLTSILVATAEYEVDAMTEIRMRGSLERALSGVRPTKLNYGYGKRNGKVVIIPKEADFVKQAFTLYATGNYSLNSLSNELFELGYHYKNQRSGKIPRASLASMLKSIYYTGKYYFPGHEGIIQGKHKPIIDDELFNQVQKVLKKPSSEIKEKHQFLYNGLIKYKETGGLMSGEVKKGGKYIYYTARNADNSCCCINEEIVTKNVLNRLELIKLNNIPKDIIANEVLKEHLKPISQALNTAKRAVSRQYHEELKLKEYVDTNGIEDTDFIESEYAEIEKKYKDVSSNIQMLEDKITAQQSKYQEVLNMNLAEVFKILTLAHRRQILELIKSKFEGDCDKKIKITFKSAFRKLLQK
jgi:site-specific DNA recombinase